MIDYYDFRESRSKAFYTVAPIFEKAGLTNEALKIMECGNGIITLDCKECGEHYFKGFIRCKSKYCPICAKLRSYIWCSELYPVITDWLEKGNYVFFANFTIENTDTLEEGVTLLNNAWRFMTNKLVKEEWNNRFAGTLRSMEIKKGKYSNKWHPHLHCIILKRNYSKDRDFIKDSWERAIKHYKPNANQNPPDIHGIRKDNKKGILGNIIEVVKYVTKLNFPNMTNADIVEMFNTMKGKRTINTTGNLRGLRKKTEERLKNDSSEEKITEFCCKKCNCTKSELGMLYHDKWKNITHMDSYIEVCTVSNVKNKSENKSENEKNKEKEFYRKIFANKYKKKSAKKQ